MSDRTVPLCDKCEKVLPVVRRDGLETSHRIIISQDGVEHKVDACCMAHLRAGLQALHTEMGIR